MTCLGSNLVVQLMKQTFKYYDYSCSFPGVSLPNSLSASPAVTPPSLFTFRTHSRPHRSFLPTSRMMNDLKCQTCLPGYNKKLEWRKEVLYINYRTLKLFILKLFKHIFWDGWRYFTHIKLCSFPLGYYWSL